MATVDADIEVQRLGYSGDDKGRRLLFPNAQLHKIEGHAGQTVYGASDCTFEGLEGRLDVVRWKAVTASIGGAFLRDEAGRFDMQVERAELPHGVRLVRAGDANIEILAPNVTFSELRLTLKGPFGRRAPVPVPDPAPTPVERQEKLRFLDSLSGRIYTTLKVQLDLPVLGVRTLDQQLRVPIQEGSLDYRALENSLDWLEGTFLDIKHEQERLKIQWKVPIFGGGHELI
jgi:hypothetical protein